MCRVVLIKEITMFNPFKRESSLDPAIKKRVPPGQTLTGKWPVLHFGSVPRIDLAKWKLNVYGLVEQPIEWSWDQFLALPKVERTNDIHCVTRWSRLDNHSEGVPISYVLDVVKPTSEAKFVVAHSERNFTANLPIEALQDDDVMLAYKHDGQPLSPDHGYPVRLVVPKKYFWKSAKWLIGLEFRSNDKLGFWEELGYHNDADPWKEQRYWGD